MCHPRVVEGKLPGCVESCPTEALVFGKRHNLLKIARHRIARRPEKYVDHIYGEHEVGGTSWLYLASEPFETIGFPKLGTKAPPRLTEAIQHGLFQYFAAPIILYGVLGGVMWGTGYLKDSESKIDENENHRGDSA